MAVTHGHGNPHWTRDEVVLALDLYFDCKGRIPGQADQRVRELSRVLRDFPHHATAARKESFRNPDGVVFKLQNIRQVATGRGLGNVSRVDREVWRELGNDPVRTRHFATLIRSGVHISAGLSDDLTSEDIFAEGRIVTGAHSRRERNPSLRKKLLKSRRNAGALHCQVCGCSAPVANPALEDAIFEAHHILPLSASAERKTRLADMALVCANCHRLVHRAISFAKRWLSMEEAVVAIFNTKR